MGGPEEQLAFLAAALDRAPRPLRPSGQTWSLPGRVARPRPVGRRPPTDLQSLQHSRVDV
jgi:hypothetical protein